MSDNIGPLASDQSNGTGQQVTHGRWPQLPWSADFIAYEQEKFRLADVVRRAATLFSSDDPVLRDRTRELIMWLATDRFNLVVIGQFNRGKTSLMNALLGTDRLPVGIVPVTSAITTVLYGSAERVSLRYEGGGLPSEVALAALPDYITERGNPGNARRVKTADVYLPVDLLRRGLALIDTPGLGSAIVENSRTTEEFFPEADALLLVTSYESPLSDDEMRFLERSRRAGMDVFVALNKQDIVAPDEREQVQAYVAERLRILAPIEPVVFSVSARDALAGKLGLSPARFETSGLPEREAARSLLETSGLPALEAALLSYLLAKKVPVFLKRMTDRITDLVRQAAPGPASGGLLAALSRNNSATTARLPAVASGEGDDSAAATPVARCEVCERVGDDLFGFLRRYQFDLTMTDEVRQRHVASHGFCSVHTWQYEALASPRGIALSYPILLDALAATLAAAAQPEGDRADLRRQLDALLPGGDSCPACATRADAESRAIAALGARLQARAEHLGNGPPSLCLPHLRLTVYALGDHPAAVVLVRHEASSFSRLAEDLQRLALRLDALRRDLLTTEERNAPGQALALLAGERRLVTLNTGA